jgi:hypothetical protein
MMDAGRRRLRRLARPLVVAGVLAAATGYLAAVDPARPGHDPGCPFFALTGKYCPGCGGLRAVHDLTHGDVLAALSANAVLTLAVPVAVVLWFQWVLRLSHPEGRPELFPEPRPARPPIPQSDRNDTPGPDPKVPIPPGIRAGGLVALAIGLILFAVLRNLPGFGGLAP